VAAAEPLALTRLPHGTPALLLTGAFAGPAAGIVRGIRRPDSPDPLANAAGFLPQCLLVEMMAQTAGLGLPDEARGAFVAGIRDLRWRRAAPAGAAVEVEARLERRLGPVFRFDCRARSGGLLLARGSITLRVT